jgi:lysophospholipase
MKLISIAANPAPDDAFAGVLTTPDGHALRFARFAPPSGRRGTICLFPGRTEFIEKYFETVDELRQRGFGVAVLDWRGQGLSDRPLADRCKSHVRSFAEYDTDLESFMRDVVLPDCAPPLFALAHSMGSAVLIRAAARGRRWFDRMVLSAPMIALTGHRLPRVKKALVRVLSKVGFAKSYVPGGRGTIEQSKPFAGNPLTSDPVRYARNAAIIEAEPALGLGAPTFAWANAAFNAMDAIAETGYPSRIRQPMLIIAAGSDGIVSTPATEEFAIRLRAGAHVIIPGARHELLMEQDRLRAQFWAAFDAFVPGSGVY